MPAPLGAPRRPGAGALRLGVGGDSDDEAARDNPSRDLQPGGEAAAVQSRSEWSCTITGFVTPDAHATRCLSL